MKLFGELICFYSVSHSGRNHKALWGRGADIPAVCGVSACPPSGRTRAEIVLEAGLDRGLQGADKAMSECRRTPQLLYFILRVAAALNINSFKCCKGRSVPHNVGTQNLIQSLLQRSCHRKKPYPKGKHKHCLKDNSYERALQYISVVQEKHAEEKNQQLVEEK